MAVKLYYSMGEVTEMFDVEPSLIRYWCSQFSCLRPKRNAKGNRMFSPQDIERLKRIHHLLREKKMTIEGAQKAMRKSSIEAEKNDSDMALLEQLQTLRAMLVDMRQTIGDDTPLDDNFVEEQSTTEVAAELTVELVAEPVAEPTVEPVVADVVEAPIVEAQPVEEVVEPQVEAVEELTIEDIFEVKAEETVEVSEPSVEAVAEPQNEDVVETAPEEVVAKEEAAPMIELPEVETVAESQPQPTTKKKRAPRRKLIGEEGVVERPLFPFYEQTLF